MASTTRRVNARPLSLFPAWGLGGPVVGRDVVPGNPFHRSRPTPRRSPAGATTAGSTAAYQVTSDQFKTGLAELRTEMAGQLTSSHCETPESFMRSTCSTNSTLRLKRRTFLAIRRKTSRP